MAQTVVDTIKTFSTQETATLSFWADKTPCYQLCNCPDTIRRECPAERYQFLPCWEIEGTYCKLDDHGVTGRDTTICEICRVYKKYGNSEPIEIKLIGKGIDARLRELEGLRL